jgi:hypothetical protein
MTCSVEEELSKEVEEGTCSLAREGLTGEVR